MSESELMPTRPINMQAIRMYLLAVVNSGVIPVDRPTVPNAEVTSKITLIKLSFSMSIIAIEADITRSNAVKVKVSALNIIP